MSSTLPPAVLPSEFSTATPEVVSEGTPPKPSKKGVFI